jgi:transposase
LFPGDSAFRFDKKTRKLPFLCGTFAVRIGSISMHGTHPHTNGTQPPLSDPALLPNDVDHLKKMILELLTTLHEQRRDNHQLRDRLDQLLRRLYGPRAERYDPNQPLLFADLLAAAEPPNPLPPAETLPPTPAVKTKKPGHGRKPLPKNLRREFIHYTLNEAERICPCCGLVRRENGTDVSRQLDYQPASLFVVEHIEHCYSCAHCKGEVVRSSKAPQVLEKGLPGPGLLAQVIVSKFVDHLPLYRQEQIFLRQGVSLARSTMGDWMAHTASVLEPLYQEMIKRVLSCQVIHTDDTILPTFDPNCEHAKKARLWVALGDWTNPLNVFDYTPDHKGDGPQLFFASFRGFLQADAYAGYHQLYEEQKVMEAACNAHARRKFFEAKDSDPAHAHRALATYRQLYAIETNLRDAEAELRGAHPMTEVEAALFREWWEEQVALRRLEEALPIWILFLDWLRELKEKALPKSPMGEAVRYVLNQEQALMRYLRCGFLQIDNNGAEREMKRVATGRKNWLFAGSDAGGKTAAILYSFVSTCQRLEINPFVYLRDLFRRLPTHPPDQLAELLPDKWQLLPAEQAPAAAQPNPAPAPSG